MKQTSTTAEEELDIRKTHKLIEVPDWGKIWAIMDIATYNDQLMAWRDAAVVEARKAMADNLIDQESKLYKVFDDDRICVGIKKMADEVREYYDGGVYEKN